ncbi:MAG: metallophosphoesterase [Spirochaetales bacterium]|nr:metallophosphoesterase [Spirochaetales bacterium]
MKITTTLILVFLLWSFTGCDFIIYYTFVPSESNTVIYNPGYSDDQGVSSEYPDEWYYDGQIELPDNNTDSPEWYLGSKEKVDSYKNHSTSVSINKKFSLIILPDTQYYTAYYPHIFKMQVEWILAHKDDLNIAFVLHEGDLVENNTVQEWERAREYMKILDGEIPYAVAAGNHDIGTPGYPSSLRDTTLFNSWFKVEQYQHLPTFGGTYEPGKLENSYHFFRAGGIDWLVVVLEFGPRDAVLNWAQRIISFYHNHRVIVLTHSYMYYDNHIHGSRPEHNWKPCAYGIHCDTGGVNSGADIWEKLISRHDNISFVFSGHILGDGTGLLVSTTSYGNKVYQMLANYQMIKNGGNGYLRIVEFDPENMRVSVKTYSPYTGKYKTDKENKFIFNDVDIFKK